MDGTSVLNSSFLHQALGRRPGLTIRSSHAGSRSPRRMPPCRERSWAPNTWGGPDGGVHSGAPTRAETRYPSRANARRKGRQSRRQQESPTQVALSPMLPSSQHIRRRTTGKQSTWVLLPWRRMVGAEEGRFEQLGGGGRCRQSWMGGVEAEEPGAVQRGSTNLGIG